MIPCPINIPPAVKASSGTTTIEGVNTPVTGRLVSQIVVASTGMSAGLLTQQLSTNFSETLSTTIWSAPGDPIHLSVRGGANSPLFSRWDTVSFTGAKISSSQAESTWSRVTTSSNWGYDVTGLVRDSTVDLSFALEGNTGLIIVTKRVRFWIHAA